MSVHTNLLKKKLIEAEVPVDSFTIKDLNNYAELYIHCSKKHISLEQLLFLQDKLLMIKDIEHILHIHSNKNGKDSMLLIEFKH